MQELREYFNTAESLFPSDTGTGPFKRTTKQNNHEKTQTTTSTRTRRLSTTAPTRIYAAAARYVLL